jgi:hypothetical protein
VSLEHQRTIHAVDAILGVLDQLSPGSPSPRGL